MPSPQFKVFLDMLVSTVRDAIAVRCASSHLPRARAHARTGLLGGCVRRAERCTRHTAAHVLQSAGAHNVGADMRVT